MKNFLVMYLKSPILVIFFLVSLVFGIPALAKTSQIDDYAVVIGVGIDLTEENQYNVSFLTFVPIPDQNFTERYKVVSAKGDSIAKAVNDAELYVGKSLRFAHIKTIGLGKELLDADIDISQLLDFWARENDVSANTKIVATATSAKEFLGVAKTLDSESSTKISQLATYNKKGLYGVETTFEDYYKGIIGNQKVSLIPIFDLDKDEGLTPVANDGGQTSGHPQQGAQTQKKKIVNTGDAVLIKDGKKVKTISSEEVKNINFLIGNYEKGFLNLKDFQGSVYKNCDLCFEIFGNTTKCKVIFENGIPVVSLSIKIKLSLTEVVSDDGVITKDANVERLTDDDLNLIGNSIRINIANALETAKENKADLANFYAKIYNTNSKKFRRFLDGLEHESDFLDNIVVKANISINIR